MQAPRFDHMSALGEAFRAARETRGLSLSDVAEQIHIRSVYLASIEAEDWAAIGAPVYVRGFIRTYARFLGLDAEAAIARFSEWVAGERPDVPAPAQLPASGSDRGGPSVWIIAVGLVAVVLVLFAGYEYYQYQAGSGANAVAEGSAAPAATVAVADGPPSPAPADSPGAVAAISPGPSSSPVIGNDRLDIRLTARSWLRVAVDGKVAMEGLFPAGTVRTISGKFVTVRAGNAGGVDVSVNGKSVGTLGGSGDVVERSFNLTGE